MSDIYCIHETSADYNGGEIDVSYRVWHTLSEKNQNTKKTGLVSYDEINHLTLSLDIAKDLVERLSRLNGEKVMVFTNDDGPDMIAFELKGYNFLIYRDDSNSLINSIQNALMYHNIVNVVKSW